MFDRGAGPNKRIEQKRKKQERRIFIGLSHIVKRFSFVNDFMKDI